MIDALTRDRSTLVWVGALIVLLLVAALFGFPAPLGVAVQGAVTGSVIAFISMGIVLIYRTNRIINFAHAEIGAIAMVVATLLIAQSKWNHFLGVAVGISIALLLGALIELTVVRRFFKAPRLILTVATVALAQLLVVIRALLPRIWDLDLAIPKIPDPFGIRIGIPDPTGRTTAVLFDGNQLMAILSVPLIIAALTAFLRFTSVGVASRAVADNAERASLLGVPVKRVSTIVWIVAAGLSGLGALWRASTIGLPLSGQAFDSGLLVRALAPAVVGRMENLRTTFFAAVVLGIVDQTSYYRTNDSAFANLVLFVVILGALLVQRRGQVQRAEELEGATWQAVKEVRPIPRELGGVPEVGGGMRALGFTLLGLLVLMGLFAPAHRLNLIALILIYGIVGASLVILTGWAGQISLGQIAFVAVGAAITGNLAMEKGYNVLLVLLVAGLAGALVAAVIGLPALRMRGLFLAASTVAFSLWVSSMVLNPHYFGWFLPRGSRLDRGHLFGLDLDAPRTFYFFIFVIVLLALASVRRLRRSRTGRVLIAARDNERAARAFAVNITAARLAAFGLSGFYAALAGGMFALHQNLVNVTAFGVDRSLQVFVMVVIGGLGSLPGALLGATYFFVTQYMVSGLLSLFLSGSGMLVVLMVVPGGIGAVVYGWRDSALRWVAKRRGIVVPSLVADVRVDDQVLLPGARRMEAEPQPVPAPTAGVAGGSE